MYQCIKIRIITIISLIYHLSVYHHDLFRFQKTKSFLCRLNLIGLQQRGTPSNLQATCHGQVEVKMRRSLRHKHGSTALQNSSLSGQWSFVPNHCHTYHLPSTEALPKHLPGSTVTLAMIHWPPGNRWHCGCWHNS